MKTQKEWNQKFIEENPEIGETTRELLLATDIRFEISKGWYDIAENFFKNIKKIKGVEVIQIKQKFGELRIYVSHTNDKIEKLIKVSTEEAEHTCEMCGVNNEWVGKKRPRFWIFNICDECLAVKCKELKV